MAVWVVDDGDYCPKCGAPLEVLVDEDNKFDTKRGISFPKAERCMGCGWMAKLEDNMV